MSAPDAERTTHTLPAALAHESPTGPPLSRYSAVDPHLLARQPWPVGHVLLDDFEVEGVLGQGGMGTVYLVRQRSTDRPLAVKRARLEDPDSRRRFLAELQLWMDLPDHPHLAPCRFFRTVSEEVVIFTDLAAGGSLADWITHARLTRLADRLDIAIQVAWGLHALHERGLVHQDVKPANVLMSADGVARVADFGLARARARFSSPAAPRDGQSTLVTAGAMTPAYCSPEQAGGRAVSRRTDVWSWGVLALEMFVGRVPCCGDGGPLAAAVLRRHLGQDDFPHPAERLPPAVAIVLERCLLDEPAARWPSLAEAANELRYAYRQRVGAAHPRPVPPAPPKEVVPAWLDRAAGRAGRWEPPRKWLLVAFEAAGRDPTEVEAVLPPPAATRRAQAVADLSAFAEAQALLERLVAAGRDELRTSLAALLVQKALVHHSVGDWPGAVELFDRAEAAWEALVSARRELAPWLVRTYLYKAEALRSQGGHDAALALCDRVVKLHDRLANRRRRREMRDDLAEAHLVQGLVRRDQGDRRAALPLLDRAIATWRQLVEQEGQSGPANDLAHAYLARAGVVAGLGRPREAAELCDQAIRLRRRLVGKEGRRDLEGDLARALVTKANVLRGQEGMPGCEALYEQAVALYERLIGDDGRDDLMPDLARAYIAQGHARRIAGEPAAAAARCGRAAELLEGLVRQQGRSDLQHELARAYLQQANALRLDNRAGVALGLCDQAAALWERLVQREGRADLSGDLARAYVSKAHVLRQLHRPRPALGLYDRAIALREGTTGDDVPAELARDRVSRAEVLVEMGRHGEARAGLAEAVAWLEAAARQRADLRGALARARRLAERLGEGR